MEKFDIFRDIAERTGGDVYVGVVGPVRTGKSTMIKKFVELMVLPYIGDENERARTTDALPQSGAGKTIMTTEPKFVPDDAVAIEVREGVSLQVRMVDCVGYAVEGALGYQETDGEGNPSARMVTTPWFDHEIPFEEAAEIGTRKVVSEHSTIALVVTTDGSTSDISREYYLPAEQRVVAELQELGKPFIIVLNSEHPYAQDTIELAHNLEQHYDVPVLPLNAQELSTDDIYQMFEQLLYEFPVNEVVINEPDWVSELDSEHWLRKQFSEAIENASSAIHRLRDIDRALGQLSALELAEEVTLQAMDLGTGVATIDTQAREDLYYQVLSELAGQPLEGKAPMIRLLRILTAAKKEWDKVEEAIRDVRSTGYGMVSPHLDEMNFEEPELIKQGPRFGVRLRANAPSIHMIRADVQTEVTPIIGTEKQCEELMQYLLEKFEDDPAKLWESDIFGKSLSELVREGIQNKLFRMPENAQEKLQETLQRIVNEGSGGLICIIV